MPLEAPAEMAADTSAQSPTLSVNGERVRSAAATLHELLCERGFDAARGEFACAVNGAFVPRAQWAQRQLAAGDCIDVVAPVVGG